MVLSANAITEEDIVEGLNAGADEYLVKPIRLNEFVARVHALLRRRQITASETLSGYNDGYLSVDLLRLTSLIDFIRQIRSIRHKRQDRG